MNKKKKLIAAILFLVVVGIIGYRTFHIMGYQDNVHTKATFEQFYNLPENSLDAVWIGASSVQEFIIGSEMYDETGMTLYPFATGNLPFNSVKSLITETEKTQDPEVYLVDIRNLAYYELTDEMVRRVTDNMNFSQNRFETINRMTGELEHFYPEQKINLLDHYIPFIKYHSRWNELEETDFADDKNSYLGYWIGCVCQPFDKKAVQSLYNAEPVAIPDENLSFLNDFLDYCDSFGKKVVFTCTPNCLDSEKFGQYNFVKDIIESRGYEVWDLNYATDQIGLDYNTDFADPMHSNIWGAQKISKYAAKELTKRFGFTDHRGDPYYQPFQTNSDNFNKRTSEIKLITTNSLSDYLDRLRELQGDYSIYVSVRDIQGYSLNEEITNKMIALGFDKANILLDRDYRMYIGVINNGETLYQNIGYGDSYDSALYYNAKINHRTITIESKSWHGGNLSSIKIGNTEYSKNGRGLNFVVVNNDTGDVIDSVSFDTHVDEYTCTR